MKLVLTIKTNNLLHIQLKRESEVIDEEGLTISQGLDKLLILSIDKLLSRNRIDRLLLKTLQIQGEFNDEAVSSMVVKIVQIGLEV